MRPACSGYARCSCLFLYIPKAHAGYLILCIETIEQYVADGPPLLVMSDSRN